MPGGISYFVKVRMITYLLLNGTLNFLKLCLIGQYVLLNSDVDGNNMNKSDAIDKEKIFKYTNDK